MHEHTCVWVATMGVVYSPQDLTILRAFFTATRKYDEETQEFCLFPSIYRDDLPETVFPNDSRKLWGMMDQWMQYIAANHPAHKHAGYSIAVYEDFDGKEAERVLDKFPQGMTSFLGGGPVHADGERRWFRQTTVFIGHQHEWSVWCGWSQNDQGNCDVTLTMKPSVVSMFDGRRSNFQQQRPVVQFVQPRRVQLDVSSFLSP